MSNPSSAPFALMPSPLRYCIAGSRSFADDGWIFPTTASRGLPGDGSDIERSAGMALWRVEAIKRLPELRREIQSADSVMALWIDVFFAFRRAYEQEPRDESLIARVYDFADWCMHAARGPDAGHDPASAATVGFYEDIPTLDAARDDMPRWLRYSEVAGSKPVFSYMIGDEKYDELVHHMARNQHRYQSRPRSGDQT